MKYDDFCTISGKKTEEYRHQLGCYGVSGDLAIRPVASLSGGQKSRVAFALMAMTSPNLLILDEPTNHLDVETIEALGKCIQADFLLQNSYIFLLFFLC